MTKYALQLIAIEHELGMAAGPELDLDTLLAKVSDACMSRLGISGVSFYFKQFEGEVILPDAGHPASMRYYRGVPLNSEATAGADFARVFKDTECDDTGVYKAVNSNEYLYGLELEDLGCMVIRRRNIAFDEPILAMLVTIAGRVALSCRAAIGHRQVQMEIAARKRAEEALLSKLYWDELTQLPNWRRFVELLTDEVAECRHKGVHGAVLYLDLNHFKKVNDLFGHNVGDSLLKAVAGVLRSVIRAEDTVARLSADEFVVMITNIHQQCEKVTSIVNTVVRKIHSAFATPVRAGEHSIYTTVSIGVIVFPDAANSCAEDLVHSADLAMYQAKSQRSAGYAMYQRAMTEQLEHRLSLEKLLYEAVERLDQFSLVYQPQFDVRHRCIGAEALLRWSLPGRGIVSPQYFIPIAEETGLILEIGRWVLRQVCSDLQELQRAVLPESFRKVAVNVSAVQFNRETFSQEFLETVGGECLASRMLGVELTESVLVDSVDQSRVKIRTLVDAGVHVSIDDFGTGYSSLAYLSQFPIKTLKVDQSFIKGIDENRANRKIVEAIVALSHSLNLNVVVEGVETERELAALTRMGCGGYQGNLFGFPLPLAGLLELLGTSVRL